MLQNNTIPPCRSMWSGRRAGRAVRRPAGPVRPQLTVRRAGSPIPKNTDSDTSTHSIARYSLTFDSASKVWRK